MKKKGFTLVELLAVIAILGVIVIAVVPNVIGVFKNSKLNNFVSESRQIFKTAGNQYVKDSAKTYNVISEYKSGDSSKELQLDGRKVDYEIIFDNDGYITYFLVEDSDYKLELDGSSDSPVIIDNIKADKVIEKTE